MLDDRDYMRQPAGEPHFRRVSLTVVLIAINAAVFIIEWLLAYGAHNHFIGDYGALSLEGLEHGFVWQLLTYQFLHASIWHLLFNCWAIYVFGREIEEFLGWKKFLALYFSAGLVGGLCQMLAALLWPQLFGGAVVGASACGFGLVAAFAALFPQRELMMLLFFVIPIRLSAKTLLILSAVLAVVGIVFPFDNVANAAHLGGMLTGIVFVRKFVQGIGWQFRSRRAAPRPQAEELSRDEFLESEVDPILDKISAKGIQSLTARERDILEKARHKMERR